MQVQAWNLEPEIWVYSAQLPWALMGNAPGVTTGSSFWQQGTKLKLRLS